MGGQTQVENTGGETGKDKIEISGHKADRLEDFRLLSLGESL